LYYLTVIYFSQAALPLHIILYAITVPIGHIKTREPPRHCLSGSLIIS